jgi:hypothetical protein
VTTVAEPFEPAGKARERPIPQGPMALARPAAHAASSGAAIPLGQFPPLGREALAAQWDFSGIWWDKSRGAAARGGGRATTVQRPCNGVQRPNSPVGGQRATPFYRALHPPVFPRCNVGVTLAVAGMPPRAPHLPGIAVSRFVSSRPRACRQRKALGFSTKMRAAMAASAGL